MKRMKNSQLEWQVTENDDEWEALVGELEETAQQESTRPLDWRSRHLWLKVAAFLVCIMACGSWLLYSHQASRKIVAAELESALEEGMVGNVESDSLVEQDTQDALVAMRALDKPDVAIHQLALRDEDALVEAIVARVATDGSVSYRRITRSYSRVGEDWMQVPLTPRMWGGVASLEAEHIIYKFRERDRAAVEAVAPKIDAFYALGAAYLGLPVTGYKLVINVDVTASTNMNTILIEKVGAFDDAVTVPSSARFEVPADLSNADFLEQMLYPVVSKHLGDRLHASIGHDHASGLRRNVMIDALQLWLLWQADGPVAESNQDTIYRLFADSMVNEYSYPNANVPEVYRMCGLYDSLEMLPLFLSIPVACLKDGHASYVGGRISPSLASIGGVGPLNSDTNVADEWATVDGWSAPEERAPLSLVLDYILDAYSAGQVTTFVHAYTQHEEWETLVPAVFGISLDEFQAGWWEYLAE